MHACTLFSCDPISTTCQCHVARSPFRADGLDLRICSYLDEALNEVFRQRRAFGIFFRSEVLEYVCELLPEVQGFLLHFHIVSMFLPITFLCVLSCPVQYISQLPCFCYSLFFSSLLFSSSLLSLPTAYIHLPSPSLSPPPQKKRTAKKATHLKLLMTIKQQNIHRLQLIHISMPLKFLSNFGSNFRHGHIERIHRLDFRCLLYPHTHTYIDDQYSFFHVRIPHPSLPLPLSPSLLSSFLFLPSSQHHVVSKSKKKSNIPLSTNPDNSTRLSVSHHSMSRLLVAKKNIPH